MYDIVFISYNEPNAESNWRNLKARFPTAKRVDSFEQAQQQSLTKMFWVVWPGIIVNNDFDFSYKADDYSLDVTHVFRNGENFDGICLFPKYVNLHQREIDYRFFASKKEVNIIASTPSRYDIITVSTYEDYQTKLLTCKSQFVYVVPERINVEYNFEYTVPYNEKDLIHVFKNGKYYDGIFLQHKNKVISKHEFEYSWYTNKKEVDIVVSTPKPYDKIVVNTYHEFCKLRKTVSTEFFYVIPGDVDVNWNFDYHLPYYDRDNIHVFKNGKFHDGVFLIHKDKPLAQREFEYRFFTRKKEVDIVVSTPKPYDIVFISYNEPNADANYVDLQQHFPRAKRIHGVKGIHQAHIAAAKLCDTDMFWIVDGDAQVLDDFAFDHQVPKWQRDQVFVWRSRNPINDLEYGYGGIKLFPVKETLNMDTSKPDMTTSISSKFNAMPQISNITAFSTDPFNTWKSAFRECCKLASKTIRGQVDIETEERLKVWCEMGSDSLFGKYAIHGACAGRDFGNDNKHSPDKLNLINDFDWLYEQFSKHTMG